MDKYTYLILDGLFFLPLMSVTFFLYGRTLKKRWKFICIAGLLGAIWFFIVDPLALTWGAWTMDYTKTVGIRFGPSVVEEFIWGILVCMNVAILIEIGLAVEASARHPKKS